MRGDQFLSNLNLTYRLNLTILETIEVTYLGSRLRNYGRFGRIGVIVCGKGWWLDWDEDID